MYLPEDEIERGALRQGDVISGIHCLGALKVQNIAYTTNQKDEVISWNVQGKPSYNDVMLLSHSCELDEANTVKVTSAILAPIRKIDEATNAKNVELLISSNIIEQDGGTQASFLKYFYLEPNALMEFADGAIVDFSKSFSVHKSFLPTLLDRKISQLTEETRAAMSVKCALFFHRDAAA